MTRHRSVIAVLSVVALVISSLLFAAVPAGATTGWDPDDQRGPIDLRWAGAYRQDRDTVRVGIRLWDPVLRATLTDEHRLMLSLNPHERDADARVLPRKGGGWTARFFDDGFRAPLFRARVSHPSGTLFRLWLPARWAKGEQIIVMAIDDSGDRYREDRIDVFAP